MNQEEGNREVADTQDVQHAETNDDGNQEQPAEAYKENEGGAQPSDENQVAIVDNQEEKEGEGTTEEEAIDVAPIDPNAEGEEMGDVAQNPMLEGNDEPTNVYITALNNDQGIDPE